jgi:hypothetical protein
MPGLRGHDHPWGIANRRRRLQFWSERIEQLRRPERFYRAAHIEHADPINFGPAQVKHTDPKIVTDANTDAHTDSNADADAHTDANTHADAHTDAHAHTDPHADARTRLIRHRP